TVTLLSYISLVCLFIAFQKQAKNLIYSAILSFVLLFTMVLKTRLEHRSFVGLKIYNTRKELSIAYIRQGNVHLLSSCDSLQHKSLKFSVLPDLKKYVDRKSLKFNRLSAKNRNHLLNLADDLDLYIQNSSVQDHRVSKVLLLRNNARLPKELQAAITILDGSNSDQHIENTIAVLKRQNRAYYVLKDNFAYVWESNQDGKN